MTNVVPLGKISLADIPGQLRRLADDIESGEYGEIPACVVVIEQPGDQGTSCAVFGYGKDNDPIRAAGLLHFGLGEFK